MRFTKWAMAGFAIASVCVFLPARITLAATSAELADALDVDPQLVVEHNLFTINETGGGSETLSGEVAAEAYPSEGAILISNGLGIDKGLGDTDRGDDGGREYTVFTIDLTVPPGARTLSFRTRFISREFRDGENLDRAMLGIGVEPCEFGCLTAPYDLVSVAEATDTTNPNLLRIVNVDGIDVLKLEFTITDEGNGSLDSAIRISDLHFSEDPSPSGAQLTSELPPEDVKAAVGTFRFQKTLLRIPGNGLPYELTLYYNAAQTWSETFGRKWTHNYEWRLLRLQNGGLLIRAGDGGSIYFEPDTSDSWVDATSGAATASFLSSWSGLSGEVARTASGFVYTDRNQQRYEFNSVGLIVAIVDPNDNRLEFEYNPANNLSRVTDTRGNTALYNYINQYRQLISVIYETAEGPAQQVSFNYFPPFQNEAGDQFWDLQYFDQIDIGRATFTYDESGLMLTATDADNNVIVDNRYAGEILIDRADGLGASDTYRYFSDSVEQTDPLGRIQLSVFDNQDRIRRKTDPLGNSWLYNYDSHGNVSMLTDPLGNLESRSYDDRANLLSLTDPAGNTTSYEYDDDNNLLRVVDSLGSSMDYTYDALGNLVSETDPNGNSILYSRTLSGQTATTTDRNGNTWSYFYSLAGELTNEVDPLGGTRTYTYDAFGNVVEMADANTNAMSFQYDRGNRLTGVQSPTGNETSYELNAQGRRTTLTRANGATTTYEYDQNGRMTGLTDAVGGTYRSSFNAVGRLQSRTDPQGRVTSFDYDDGDRLTNVVDTLGNTSSAEYDAAGRRTSVTDPNGGTTRFEYDSLGRVTAETDAVGNVIRNGYDQRGLRSEVITGRGSRISYTYDAAGRLVGTEFPGFSIARTLDANGNVLRTVGRGGASVTREFDQLNRLVSRTDPNGRTVGYEYDAVGNVTRVIYPDGRAVDYTYDADDRLIEVVDWAGRRTTYAWDAVGNLLSVTLPDGGAVLRSYDAVDRLVGLESTTSGGEVVITGSYTYNAAGLRDSADVQYPLDPSRTPAPLELDYDEANQITSLNGNRFEYDADGNLTAGIVDETPISLEYDDRNWLTRAGDDSYRYDEDGFRVGATIDGRSYEYTQDTNAMLPRVLEEFDVNGDLISRYVYGIGLISREDAEGNVSIYHFDSRGSTVALVNLEGEVTDRYAYDPWGQVTGRIGSTENPFTFNGRIGVMDDGNGLYLMGVRHYAPLLMRFLQRDPVQGNLLIPQSLNRYAFARGNPIQRADPTGEHPALIILGGVAIGIAGEIAFDWATGEFDPFNDPWLPYLENNWVDLTIGGITGAFAGASVARWASKIKRLEKAGDLKKVVKLLEKGAGWVDREILKAWLVPVLTEYVLFPLLDTDNWTSLLDSGGEGWDWISGTAGDVGEGAEITAMCLAGVSTSDRQDPCADVVDWIETAAGDVWDWVEGWFD